MEISAREFKGPLGQSWRCLLVLVALVMVACTPEAPLTEIVIAVDSDLSSSEMGAIRIEAVTPGGQRHSTLVDLTDGSVRLPATIGLKHVSGALSPVRVLAAGLKDGETLVTLSAETAFIEGESLLLRLVLQRSCLSVSCEPGSTCLEGVCASEVRPAASLPRYQGSIQGVDGGMSDIVRADTSRDVPGTDALDASYPDTVDLRDATSICTCADEDAECTLDRNGFPVCRHRTATCSAVRPCGVDGYGCDSTVCVCTDPEACGPACSTDADCGFVGQCSEDARCTAADSCELDWECPAGEFCGEGRCRREVLGAVDEGGACGDHPDCATGRCLSGVCAQPCRSNNDCAPALRCAGAEPSLGLLCLVGERECPGDFFLDPTYGTCSPGPACRMQDECKAAAQKCVWAGAGPRMRGSIPSCQVSEAVCRNTDIITEDGGCIAERCAEVTDCEERGAMVTCRQPGFGGMAGLRCIYAGP